MLYSRCLTHSFGLHIQDTTVSKEHHELRHSKGRVPQSALHNYWFTRLDRSPYEPFRVTYEQIQTYIYRSIEFGHTVRMKSLTMFSGALHLLHHYKSNLAHLLAF